MNWFVIVVETCLNLLHECLFKFVCCWVWIGVIVFEVWMKNEKMVVFGENELDDDFEMNWCYNLMFVVDLSAFLCL